jgi:Ca2+-binding EF-hand superfamily protein
MSHTLTAGISDEEQSIREQVAITMDIHPDATQHYRTYPSIRDYYEANVTDRAKPVQLQRGLSNYSSLQLGDDRIAFAESILSATYRIPVESKMAIESPSKEKTKHSRRRDYVDATNAVGETELNRLERVMKDKLFQRSYATSSPFQVRKAFKFFDRECKMAISIEGFTRALEFLGFQFSDLQNTALFGRYDKELTGEIDYMSFITKAMFYSADGSDAAPMPKPKKVPFSVPGTPKEASRTDDKNADLYRVADVESSELVNMQKAELKRIFIKVDGGKGSVNKEQFELLLMALGSNLSPLEIDACLSDLGIPEGGSIPFDLFFDWWTSEVGATRVVAQPSPAAAPKSAGGH